MTLPDIQTTVDRFEFKQFQREDYARAALHDGLVLGHDTGGGKTLALFVWAALKVGFQTEFLPGEPRGLRPLAPVLLVAPGELHQQTCGPDGAEMLKAKVTRLESQAEFLRLSTPNPVNGRRELPPGYYLTSYTQLTGNGVTPFPEYTGNVVGMMEVLGLSDSDAGEYYDERDTRHEKHYERIQAQPTMTLDELRSCLEVAKKGYGEAMHNLFEQSFDILSTYHCDVPNPSFSDLPPEKKAIVRKLLTERVYHQYSKSIGESRWVGREATEENEENPPPKIKVKCVYSPSLADLCQDSFEACGADEGVKMKGEDTIIGTGVRQIAARYRMVLTATPIKNRLPDVFRLAWWATGARAGAHARFPYPDSTAAREAFAAEFLISERNLSKERETKRRFSKLTPQVCNVHRLWKLFAPIILRRRKADFGLDIVSKTRHVVRAPMGAAQARAYRFHLDAKYKDKNGMPAIGAQLQALRIAAANPVSELLWRPEGDGTPGDPRSKHTYIPKLHSALKLVHQILGAGEQVVVFSAFHDSLDALSARLQEAGVPHGVVDGRTNPRRRGVAAAQFKLGPGKSPYPVMLAGVECMSEGHSFALCNNVILLCYSWAYDKFEQAINRVHRLNSKWPVNVYPIICERSIDRKLEAMIQEKGDAAELVLDGRLLGEDSSEVNLAELLDIARKEFDADGKAAFVDERELEKTWPPLRTALSLAAKEWRERGQRKCLGLDTGTQVQVPATIVPVTATAAAVEQPQITRTATAKPLPACLAGLPLFL